MAELTKEQKKALALANARRRAMQGAPNVDVAEDVARSGLSGLSQGALSLLSPVWGTWNAYRRGMTTLEDKAAGALGVDLPERTPALMPTYSQAEAGFDKMTGGAMTYDPKTKTGEYAKTVGKYAPGAVLFGGGGSAGKVAMDAARYGLLPGVADETAGQITKGSAIEPYARLAAAILAPYAPSVVQKVITPHPVDAARAGHIATMEANKVPLTAGQKTGDTALMYSESMAKGSADAFNADQLKAFTKAVLRRLDIGDELKAANLADDLFTPDVAQKAFDVIGGRFNDLAARNKVLIDATLADDLLKSFDEFAGLNIENVPGVFEKTFKQILAAAQGVRQINGQQYQTWRSALSKASMTHRGRPAGEFASAVMGALDDALERTISAAGNVRDIGLYQAARQQYRDLLAIESAASRAGSQAAQGVITPAALTSAVKTQGKRAYVTGTRDIGNLARAGSATMYPLPNSGTAQRLDKLAPILTAGTGAGLGAAAGGGLPGITAGLMAGAMVPPAARMALMSPVFQKYLANQALGQVAAPGAQNLLGIMSPNMEDELIRSLTQQGQP